VRSQLNGLTVATAIPPHSLHTQGSLFFIATATAAAAAAAAAAALLWAFFASWTAAAVAAAGAAWLWAFFAFWADAGAGAHAALLVSGKAGKEGGPSWWLLYEAGMGRSTGECLWGVSRS